MENGQRYIWLKIVKDEKGKWIEVGLNPRDLNDFKCNCDDVKHNFYMKYPEFKCRSYKIALEKLIRVTEKVEP